MGFCSGTQIFDDVMERLLELPVIDIGKGQTLRGEVVRALIVALEDHDWDCQDDSNYRNDETVQRIMHELHPDWYEDNAAERGES